MLVTRNGHAPLVAASARVAPTATVVGHVVLGEGCVVDHGVVITSSGPPVILAAGVVVMAHAVIRSVGGSHRPAFPVTIGADCLVGPAAALAGCTLGDAVYVATQVMVFHGAQVGHGARLGAGSIVHTGAVVPERGRVGMRQFAVPAEDGGAAVITSDLTVARTHLAHAGFFDRAFDLADDDVEMLHRRSVEQLRREASEWDDARLMSLTSDDRLAIQDLLARHGHLVDDGALDRLGELFTDDVVYDLTPLGGAVLVGIDAIAASARELGDQNPVAHLVSNVLVSEQGGAVTARSKFLGVRRDGSVGSGVYDDVLRRTPDGWRIARRGVSLRREPLQP